MRYRNVNRFIGRRPWWLLHLIALTLWVVFVILGYIPGAFVISLTLIFYFLGQAIRKGVLPLLGVTISPVTFIGTFIIDVFLSLTGSTLLVTCLSSQFLLNQQNIVAAILLIFSISIALGIFQETRGKEYTPYDNESHTPSKLTSRFVGALFAVMAIGFIFSIIRLILFPWPKISGTDTFSHLAAINQILYSGGTENILQGYSYVYHSMIATLCHLSNSTAHWVLSYIHPFIYIYSLIVSFLLLVAVTKNEILSFIAICCTFAVYEHGGLLAAYYPFPVSFAFVFVYTIYLGCYILPPKPGALILILVAYLQVILVYPYVMLISAPFLYYIMVERGFLPKSVSPSHVVVFGLICLGGLFLSSMYYFILPWAGIALPESIEIGLVVFAYNLDLALLHFNLGYSGLQVLMMLLGLAACCYGMLRHNNPIRNWLEGYDFRVPLLLGSSSLILFFSPVLNSHRVELFVRPFFALLMATGAIVIVLLGSYVLDICKAASRSPIDSWSRRQLSAIVLVTILILLPVCFEKGTTQAWYLVGEQRTPEPDEMAAFLWLQDHTSVGDYILTDMATGFILRGLIFRNASTSFMREGQAKSPYIHPNLTECVFIFLNSSEEDTAVTYYSILDDSTIDSYVNEISFILVTPRTNSWISRFRTGQISRTASYRFELPSNDPAWTKFFGSEFVCVFSSGDARVLQLNATG